MINGEIGRLFARLGVDSADFDSGMARADRRTTQWARNVGRTTAAAGAVVGAALAAMTRAGLTAIDAQAKLATSLNTTVVSVQTLERAGDLAGIGMEKISGAARQMQTRLSQAAGGTGPAIAALEALQLTAGELQALPLDERIGLINDRMEQFIAPGQRAAVSAALFGEEAGVIISRLDNDVIAQAARDISEMGVAISDIDAAAVETANDSLSRLALVGDGLRNKITVALAPALERMAEFMVDVSRAGGPLSQVIDLVAGNIEVLVAGVAVLVGGAGLALMPPLLAAVGTGLALLVSPFALVAGAAVGMAVLFPQVRTAISEFGGWVVAYYKWLFRQVRDAVAWIAEKLNVGLNIQISAASDRVRDIESRFSEQDWAILSGQIPRESYIRNGDPTALENLSANAAELAAAETELDALHQRRIRASTSPEPEGDDAPGGDTITPIVPEVIDFGGGGGGTATSTEAEESLTRAQTVMRDLAYAASDARREVALIRMPDKEKEKADRLRDAIRSIEDAGEVAGPAMVEQMRAMIDVAVEGESAAERMRSAFDDAVDRMRDGFDEMTNNLSSALARGSASLDDFFAGWLEKEAAFQLQRRVFQPVSDALFGGAGGGSGIVGDFLAGMMGGIGGGPATTPTTTTELYAKGGVVTGATAFSTRTGPAVMGEAGPEAIMPLSRLSDGSLGVRADSVSGQRGGDLQVNIYEAAVDGPAQVRQGAGRLDVMLSKGVSDAIGGGSADGVMRARFGLTPVAKGGA